MGQQTRGAEEKAIEGKEQGRGIKTLLMWSSRTRGGAQDIRREGTEAGERDNAAVGKQEGAEREAIEETRAGAGEKDNAAVGQQDRQRSVSLQRVRDRVRKEGQCCCGAAGRRTSLKERQCTGEGAGVGKRD